VGGAGTLIGVANYPGCERRSEFAGFARFGFAKSQHRFVYSVRLMLLTDLRGLPLGYTIVPATEKEYEPLADLFTSTGTRLRAPARRLRHPAAEARKSAHRRQSAPRARARFDQAGDRERRGAGRARARRARLSR
jgi:hypothetical protein